MHRSPKEFLRIVPALVPAPPTPAPTHAPIRQTNADRGRPPQGRTLRGCRWFGRGRDFLSEVDDDAVVKAGQGGKYTEDALVGDISIVFPLPVSTGGKQTPHPHAYPAGATVAAAAAATPQAGADPNTASGASNAA